MKHGALDLAVSKPLQIDSGPPGSSLRQQLYQNLRGSRGHDIRALRAAEGCADIQ